MRVTVTTRGNLAETLRLAGHSPDLRCGGRGSCGRCTVTLLTGVWSVDGRLVHAPAKALACRTRLLSDSGTVEFTPVPESGSVASVWNSSPLPVRDETVVAVDIGTTTIAAVKINHGEVIGRAGCFNEQARYGDNVVTRINATATDLAGLRASVRHSIAELLDELGLDDVTRIAVAGNTVMTSLFHGIDPTPIGVMPFTPLLRVFPESDWEKIPLLTMPCISGYVGGDLTAGLYETRLQPGEMLVDIGTNCEIIFNTPAGIICTAAAAGPAFEGAGVRFGSRATPGAIDHYFGTGDYSVIDGGKARGLCGSAYIDFLAVERRRGSLSEFGRFIPRAEQLNITDDLFVHESDIEQLLKAKAAVRAGIITLEQHCNLSAAKIYLAGGFARHLDLANAVAIDMLPERQYAIVGNTSLAGAARLAAAPEILPELIELIDLPRELPLNTLSGFEDNFIDGLMLP